MQQSTADAAGAQITTDTYAKWLLRVERRRDDHVHVGGRSHWLMLVDLLVAEGEQRDVCTTSLCIAGGVPGTTGLRHIQQLVATGMIVEHDDPFDRRRRLLRLTHQGRKVVEDELASEAAMMASTFSKKREE